MRSNAPRWLLLMIVLAVSQTGCGSGTAIETAYGRTRGESINGTGTLAELFRSRGHQVRTALRTNETVSNWADVIVRFSPFPGPIDRHDAEWLNNWLNSRPGRQLIYVVRDFDAGTEFWDAVLKAQPAGTDPDQLRKIEQKRDNAKTWAVDLPPRTKTPADPAGWFEFDTKIKGSAICKTLDGAWAEGVDPVSAALPHHDVFKVSGGEDILLSGDSLPLVIGWTYANQSRVMVLANASFLLNATLLNHARRPLALRTVDSIGPEPRHVAFLEGRRAVIGEGESESDSSSQFHLLTVTPFDWITVHFLVFLAILASSFAVRLGRAEVEPSSGVDRPSAHPEALGAILFRTRRADAARFLLDSYRRWRSPSPLAGRSAPNPLPPR